MKKVVLSFILALLMGLVIANTALAAQALGDGYGGMHTYQATPTGYAVYVDGVVKKSVYDADANRIFNADGKTNYPYEIYLPNEKNPAQYRIHTNYTKNTDACASCHATHTAVGQSLLQWYSTYETCMACHDGTVTTTYNVVDGKIGTTSETTFGGAFGNGAEHYASKHNVQGSVSIAAAPGGSTIQENVTAEGMQAKTLWNVSFGCESCHSPHGQGGSARILNPDPNGYASKLSQGVYYELVSNGSGGFYAKDAGGNKVTLIKGYPYKINYYTASKAAATGVSATISNVGDTTNGSYTTFSGSIGDAVYVKGVAALSVKMGVSNYLAETSANGGKEIVQHTAGINTFCGACHVDYDTEVQANVNSGSIMGDATNRPGYGALTGEYSKAHRHSVGLDYDYGGAADKVLIGNDKLMMTMQGKISCLTCHFAHGTSQEFWLETAGKADAFFSDASKLVEISGSSALKRLPNMGTCEACHQKADANEGYAANSNLITLPDGSHNLEAYMANAAHKSYFAGKNYQGASDCLSCHPSTANDIMNSAHWQIGKPSSSNKDFYGDNLAVKDSQVFNGANGFSQGMPFGMSDRFCGFPGGAAGVSWAYTFKDADGKTQEGNSCGRCHISIGTTMPTLFTDFMGKGQGLSAEAIAANNAKQIDCLPCHIDQEHYDTTMDRKVENTAQGPVWKYGTREGVPHDRNFDLAKVGKEYEIKLPSNKNCMSCHEHAVVGALYKREGLFDKTTDVHAARNMKCTDCHVTERHQIPRGAWATDLVSNDRPDVEVSCTAARCHSNKPHDASKHPTGDATKHAEKINFLNEHTDKIACQSCHLNNTKDSYAEAAMAFVNESQSEKGYDTFTHNLGNKFKQQDLFKGGALYYDYRWMGIKAINGSTAAATNQYNGNTYQSWQMYPQGVRGDGYAGTTTDAIYGFIGATADAGYTPFILSQPGNYAWRWYNGTGTGMANALASFGFYDPYYFQDGFAGFRGTTQLPAPAGFGPGPNVNTATGIGTGGTSANYLAGVFAGYWDAYNNPAMFSGSNAYDKEYYQGPAARKGANGDKIYAFRKAQFWMPVPRTNFWFLTPQEQSTLRDADTNNVRNFASIQKALESPMMYMFFSEMFQPAMSLYAKEFGFEYMYTPVSIDQVNAHPMYKNLVAGLGGMGAYVGKLNGYIYDTHAYWIDAPTNLPVGDDSATRSQYKITNAMFGLNHYQLVRPTSAEMGQQMLEQGMLASYMYFPMPLDANLASDHAVAGPGFKTGVKPEAGFDDAYEPRSCVDCHKTPNGGSVANAKPFDNTDWNPLNPMASVEDSALSWISSYTGDNQFDWVTLGYTGQELKDLTTNLANKWGVDYTTLSNN